MLVIRWQFRFRPRIGLPLGNRILVGDWLDVRLTIEPAITWIRRKAMVKKVVHPMSEREAVRAAVTRQPFDLSHVDPIEAYRWGLATAKRLRRRRRQTKH